MNMKNIIGASVRFSTGVGLWRFPYTIRAIGNIDRSPSNLNFISLVAFALALILASETNASSVIYREHLKFKRSDNINDRLNYDTRETSILYEVGDVPVNGFYPIKMKFESGVDGLPLTYFNTHGEPFWWQKIAGRHDNPILILLMSENRSGAQGNDWQGDNLAKFMGLTGNYGVNVLYNFLRVAADQNTHEFHASVPPNHYFGIDNNTDDYVELTNAHNQFFFLYSRVDGPINIGILHGPVKQEAAYRVGFNGYGIGLAPHYRGGLRTDLDFHTTVHITEDVLQLFTSTLSDDVVGVPYIHKHRCQVYHDDRCVNWF
jgi:hypothetical protein